MRLLCLCVHRNMNVITPPHPTPPHRSLIMKEQCLYLQDSKKDDEVAVPVFAQEDERYYSTPPHRSLIMKEQCLCVQDSKTDDDVAVRVGAREHERYYPTPPHPTGH